MLTRALFLAGGWFVLSLVITLWRGHRFRQGGILLSMAWLFSILLAGDIWAYLTFGVPNEIYWLTGITLVY